MRLVIILILFYVSAVRAGNPQRMHRVKINAGSFVLNITLIHKRC